MGGALMGSFQNAERRFLLQIVDIIHTFHQNIFIQNEDKGIIHTFHSKETNNTDKQSGRMISSSSTQAKAFGACLHLDRL